MSKWIRRSDRMINAQLAEYRRELSASMRGAATAVCPRCGSAAAASTRRVVSGAQGRCPRCFAPLGSGADLTRAPTA